MRIKVITEKIINVILNALIFVFGIILLISIYNNLQVKVFGKDYSDFFGYSIFEVQTGSMKDAINPGDWIIVKSASNIKLNDVITYKQGNDFITHRVIGVYNDTYVTKGDANNSKDDPIDKKQIVGKVVKTIPNFGIFKKTIFNPGVLVAIIITIMVINFLFKNKNKETEKVDKVQSMEKLKNISDNIITTIKEKRIKEKEVRLEKEKIKKQLKEEAKQKEVLFEEKKEEVVKLEESTQEIFETEDAFVDEISSFIPVDASELDETFLEIAQNEIEEEPEKQKIKEVSSMIEEEPEKETSTKINLDLLENSKKSKNIIDKFISIKIEEINEIVNILDDDGKTYVNEPTIKNKLIISYIDARYYNYFGNTDVSSNKKQSLKIEKYLDDVTSIMKEKYKGSDSKYSEKLDRFLCIFKVIANLEQAKSIDDKRAREEFYKKEIMKYAKKYDFEVSKIKTAISSILKIQRNYVGIIEYLFKKLETNMFKLEFNRFKTDKNIYALNLEHNITFSQIYSDYIIDKTYNEGVIAESKTLIMLNLLSTRIVSDMQNSEFNNKYVLYLPKSLYSKEKKIEKVLSMIEDEHAKLSTILLMRVEDLLKYKTLIKKLKKEGYQFAIAIDAEFDIKTATSTAISLIDYIFVDKNIPNIVKTLSSLPEDVTDKFIYENIVEKIGDFGGE